MRRSIWVLAAMALVGTVVLMVGAGEMVQSVSGVEETQRLERLVRTSWNSILAAEPPARVTRMPGETADQGWRWRVEATVADGVPADRVARMRSRLAQRALATRIGAGRAAGLLLVLHGPGAQRREFEFDAQGRPLSVAPPPPVPTSAPAATPPTPEPAPAAPPPADEPSNEEEESP